MCSFYFGGMVNPAALIAVFSPQSTPSLAWPIACPPSLDQMHALHQAAGGLTIGILPGTDESEASDAIDVPIISGMGSARDNINALSGTVMVRIETSAGPSW